MSYKEGFWQKKGKKSQGSPPPPGHAAAFSSFSTLPEYKYRPSTPSKLTYSTSRDYTRKVFSGIEFQKSFSSGGGWGICFFPNMISHQLISKGKKFERLQLSVYGYFYDRFKFHIRRYNIIYV